jgi:molybdopterin molybdotransferase
MKWRTKSYVSIRSGYNKLRENIKIQPQIEYVDTLESYGRVLYKDVISSVDIPPRTSSHMDGMAVIAADIKYASPSTPITLNIVRNVGLGNVSNHPLHSGQASRIPTGGYLPPRADTVVPVEQTRILSKNKVAILSSLSKGSFTSASGMDVKKGAKLFHRGAILRAQDVALLSMVGITRVLVFKRPKVAIIPTGDELTDNPREIKQGKIFNTNSHIISRLVQEAGGVPMDLGTTADKAEEIQKKMKLALTKTDIILTIGGSSMGEHDVVEESINSMGSPGILVHGVKLDRGRVTGVGVIKGKAIIILPGPIQGSVGAFVVFVQPLLRFLSGLPEFSRMGKNCTLAKRWEARTKFRDFVKVVFVQIKLTKYGKFRAIPVTGETAAMTVLTRANGYILVPEKTAAIEAGEQIHVNLLPGLSYTAGYPVDFL